MTIAETREARRTSTFPAEAVAGCLRDELIAAIRAEAYRKGKALPQTSDELMCAAIEIDSLIAVETLCALDDILPFEVGESVVRAGGYSSLNSAVEHLIGRIEKEWLKRHNGGTS